MKIAPLPERPIDRCLADPSLLAHLFVHKLDYHAPYYRQETESERHGFRIGRGNMTRWQYDCGGIALRIADAMWSDALSRSCFAMDATGTAIRAKERHRYGHVWAALLGRCTPAASVAPARSCQPAPRCGRLFALAGASSPSRQATCGADSSSNLVVVLATSTPASPERRFPMHGDSTHAAALHNHASERGLRSGYGVRVAACDDPQGAAFGLVEPADAARLASSGGW